MRSERLVGLFIILIIFFLILFIFYPRLQSVPVFNEETSQSDLLDGRNQRTLSNSKQFLEFTESDYAHYVYRAHVLSSRENAERLKEQIYNGGMPSFVEVFDENQDLFAIYVGPFSSQEDITKNMNKIQILSESDEGEIFTWSL